MAGGEPRLSGPRPARGRRAWLAAAAAGLLAACARSDPERELRATIAAMQQAIERRQAGEFAEALADDFSRESGAFGKQDARRALAAALLRHERITVSAVVAELQIDGDRARVRLRVVTTGGGGLLPETGRIWEIDSAWRRAGGRWQVFNAEWREGF